MLDMKQCELCGKDFEPAKPWATFCNERCRVRAFRQRKREARPTFDLEQALQKAIRQLRAGKTKKAVATARAALDKFDPPRGLLARYERALAGGVKPIEVAKAVGYKTSSTLSRWRNRSQPLPAAKAEALARWLDAHGNE